MVAHRESLTMARAGRFAVAREIGSKGHFIKQKTASNDVPAIEV
jgi:hypothetical protein